MDGRSTSILEETIPKLPEESKRTDGGMGGGLTTTMAVYYVDSVCLLGRGL